MTKKKHTPSTPTAIATADLAGVQGGTYFRTNVLGDFGAELDNKGNMDIYDGGFSPVDVNLDSRVEWVGTKP